MRHGSRSRKFGRVAKKRNAFMRGLAVALIQHNRITTTQARAKELRPMIEKMITKSKTPSIATTRTLRSQLPAVATTKLIKELGPKFVERKGGYTRIRLLPQRASDGAKMALIEFVS